MSRADAIPSAPIELAPPPPPLGMTAGAGDDFDNFDDKDGPLVAPPPPPPPPPNATAVKSLALPRPRYQAAVVEEATVDGLTLDEVVGSVAILSILALIAVCLVYFCLRKYCCQPAGSRKFLDMQPPELVAGASSISSASLNHNSLPSVQKAVDGSHSPNNSVSESQRLQRASQATLANPANQTRASPIERRARARIRSPRARVVSPGQRAAGVVVVAGPGSTVGNGSTIGGGGGNPVVARSPKRRRPSAYKMNAVPSAPRRSQISGTTSRIHSRIDSSQPAPKQNSSPRKELKMAQQTALSQVAAAGAGAPSPASPLKSLIKSQFQDSFVPPPNRGPVQTINLSDTPITAELINKQTKDPTKEYSLFKTPNFND